MKAITTTVIPPTATKPRRYKASAPGVPSIIASYSDSDDPHRAACEALCQKYGWSGPMAFGDIKAGFVWVFCNPRYVTEINVYTLADWCNEFSQTTYHNLNKFKRVNNDLTVEEFQKLESVCDYQIEENSAGYLLLKEKQ